MVPRIIRDRLDECDPKPNAYYKLPFSGGYPGWQVTQGNFGTLSHYGDSSYAFDFANFEGAPIYAARGGTVIDVVKDQTCNNWGLEALVQCPGNRLVVRHEDGSESWYIHMPKNGVLPAVGDTVKRGQFVAVVGNTGHSSGPHLHFAVKNPGEPTHEIKFHAYWWPSNLPRTCHIPWKGSMEWSILQADQ
jgi:murein DD-endopeptidase MepM/ murein hydrolase activator NlpD